MRLGVGTSAPLIRAEAERALELDPGLVDAHMELARLKADYEWDWPGSEREYQAALKLNASLPEAHMGYAMLLQTVGRDDEAVRESERAIALQPLSPAALSDAGRILYRARRYADARARFEEALRIEPDFVPALVRRGDVEFVTDLEAYRATVARLGPLERRLPTYSIEVDRGRLAARAGRRDEALAVAAAVERASRAGRRGESSFVQALIYAAAGDRSRTLAALEEGVRARSLFPLQLRDPQFNLLRDEPRFKALLAQLRMEP